MHEEDISVILLSGFFLSKAILPPGSIYQCLGTFLIVTTRGMLLTPSEQRPGMLPDTLRMPRTAPCNKDFSGPKWQEGPVETRCSKEQDNDTFMPDAVHLTFNSVP